jgi:hypothetical protein
MAWYTFSRKLKVYFFLLNSVFNQNDRVFRLCFSLSPFLRCIRNARKGHLLG